MIDNIEKWVKLQNLDDETYMTINLVNVEGLNHTRMKEGEMKVYIYVDSVFAFKTTGYRCGAEIGDPDFNIDIEL